MSARRPRLAPARAIAAALAVVLALGQGRAAFAAAGGQAAAAPPATQERPPDPTDLINAVLGGLLGFKDVTGPELQDEVAEAGGITFRAPVPLDYLSPADLARYLKDVLDEEYPPVRALADQRTLVAFDLLPAGVDLRSVRARVLEENIAGFYDERPGKKRLYAVSEDRTLTPANQLVLSHELRHALQDQYADVHRILPDDVGDFDDRRMAFVSLLEGDATLVMERFLMGRLAGSALGGQGDASQISWPTPPVPGVPPVVRDQLVLPYTMGRDFARAVQQRGGWDAVKAAWSAPPASMEQVLHPEKFFAHEAPRVVRIRYAPPHGRLLEEGVLGELFTRTFLAAGSGEDAPLSPAGAASVAASAVPPPTLDEIDRAAAGWGGDSYRSWDVGGKTLLVWRSEWDRVEDAREFQETALRRLQRTHGPSRPLQGAALFARGGWLMAVAASGDAVVLVASDDPSLVPAALKAVVGGGA
ncbi:MAG TPA: hypothetical protein VGQ33_24115 [Vicinamibacteria bacterium]|nr:hypothetical protein [Vicinamibacteria bacterium]